MYIPVESYVIPSQSNESHAVIVTVNEELLFIVRSNVTVLSHPERLVYKFVYIPVESYVIPSQSNESHAVTVTVFDSLKPTVRSKITVLSHPFKSV